MHETAVAQSIVDTVLAEAAKQDAVGVESVKIVLGDLTFLGTDQIRFWVTTQFQGTIAETAELIFETVPGALRCADCGYEGPLRVEEDPAMHFKLPSFSCPRCSGAHIEIIRGREAVIETIRLRKE